MTQKQNILVATVLVILAVAARIINTEVHFLYNFAPVAAIGLFSGAVLKDKRLAFLLTIMAQFVSDIYIQLFTQYPGFYGIEQFFVYGGMVLVTLLGTTMGRPRALKVLGYSIAGTLLFFIVSNFGVWMAIQFGRVDLYGYGTGFQGLVNTFAAALPFYRSDVATNLFTNTLLGDVLYSGALFGAYYAVTQSVKTHLQKA